MFSFNVLSFFKSFFPADDLSNTFDEEIAQINFGETQAIRVGDIPSTTCGGRVNTSCTTSLKSHLFQDILEVFTSGEERNFHHGTSTETCTQIGWAGENVTKMFVV